MKLTVDKSSTLASVLHLADTVFQNSVLLSFVIFIKLELQREKIREMLVLYHLVNTCHLKTNLVLFS